VTGDSTLADSDGRCCRGTVAQAIFEACLETARKIAPGARSKPEKRSSDKQHSIGALETENEQSSARDKKDE